MVLLCQRLDGLFCRPGREFMATMTIRSSKYYLGVCQVLFPLPTRVALIPPCPSFRFDPSWGQTDKGQSLNVLLCYV